MPEKLDLQTYEALQGEVMGHSDWITVDQKMIDGFCDVTGDYQFMVYQLWNAIFVHLSDQRQG